MPHSLSDSEIQRTLNLLNGRLARNGAPPTGIVVCGGAALIVLGLNQRTTNDVDIVALSDEARTLYAPAPLPEHLLQAAMEVALTLKLPADWLNNGPSRDEGGLFQMGLPEGFAARLHPRNYGSHLTVYFIDRIDQIHFKLYAAVDRGGYHISDLELLQPTDDELTSAARWAMTHDVSPGFRDLLKTLLESLGHVNAAQAI
ncbi:MAG: hypothetical protein JNK74_05355 [Candidatus Hydrogenedentes bacterium]|nr:hypothetical protein [Candidatus Hydrogenedentota bacterium]